MSRTIEDILKTEYSERFDKIRKDMMVMSYYNHDECPLCEVVMGVDLANGEDMTGGI